MTPPSISAVINTLNEEAHIADCIRSVRGFAAEVVVCDMRSTDRTVEIALAEGARVETLDAEFCDFGRLRHFAVLQARNEWVLVIDADERLTPPLASQLTRVAAEERADVVRFANLFWYFGGRVYNGGFLSNHWIRFFKRSVYLDRYRPSDERVHDDLSVLKDVGRQIALPPVYHLEHHAYPTIEKYVSKTVGMYARVEGEQYHRDGRPFSLLRLLGEPAKEFVSRFVLQRGYRDGLRGFILAVLYAMYRFTTWANVWLLEQTVQGQPTEARPSRPVRAEYTSGAAR